MSLEEGMDPYATHQQALVRAALETRGPILELGCGDYSTPILVEIAASMGRKLLVQASDAKWLDRFKDLARTELVSWASWTMPPGAWGLVLIDSEEYVSDRIKRLPTLAALGATVVLHDADVAEPEHNWKELTVGFPVQRWFRRYSPNTVILSPR